MSYSEDPSSPAAPFSGDSTGQIFELPDMVQGSVTTTERVVDTQSGFLIVVKRLTDKLSLSVKRRIGTPPASSVSLTPDESLKLSRILSTSIVDPEVEAQSEPPMESPRAIRRRNASSRLAEADSGEITLSDLVVPAQSLQNVHVPMKLMLVSVLRAFMVPIVGLVLTVFAIGFGIGVGSDKMISAKPLSVAGDLLASDPLNSQKVDSFVRDFVCRMLDFSGKTYRLSQVQAMASMSPDLLERYWQETRFPLSKKQLAALPNQTSIMIVELKQERVDQSTVQVDIKAMLSDISNPKVVTPVNLRLKLTNGEDGQIVVTDQQDISATK